MPYLDEIRGAAQPIGAINTIVLEPIAADSDGDRAAGSSDSSDSSSSSSSSISGSSSSSSRAASGAAVRRVGYNTDWLGIRRPVEAKLRKRGGAWAGGMGLVIGAGKRES